MLIRKALFAAALFLGAIGGAMVGFGGGVPLIPSSPTYSEPSQIIGTLNALINQLNGANNTNGGYAAAIGTGPSLGTFCTNAAAGGTPQTCNGQRGAVSYTGLTVAAPATNQTLVITDSAITTASVCTAGFTTAFTAATAIVVGQIVPAAGTLTVSIANAGSGTNAVTTGTLGFNCFN
jgi:hypothetical protein